MHLQIRHRTSFFYAGPAKESFNEVRLQPMDDAHQTLRAFGLTITPHCQPRGYHDLYGNMVHYFEVPGVHEELVVEASSIVDTAPTAGRAEVPSITASELESSPERELWAEFCANSPYVPLEVELWRAAQDALAEGRQDVWTDVRRMASHVYQLFTYRPKVTGIDTRATDALRLRMGVCQDYAHVLLGLCRSVGIPARYVSGYFYNPQRQPDEIEASHAWVEVLIPGYGWAAWDPTHDRAADERYVKIATGRDYTDIRPVNGTYRGAPTRELRVEVEVRLAADAALAPVVRET